MSCLSVEFKRFYVQALADIVEAGAGATLLDCIKGDTKKSICHLLAFKSGDLSFAVISDFGIMLSQVRDLHNRANEFLTKAARYGLDASAVDLNGWPNPLPAVVDECPQIEQAAIAQRMLLYLVPHPPKNSRGLRFNP